MATLLDLPGNVLQDIAGRCSLKDWTRARVTCRLLSKICPESVACAPWTARELFAALSLCQDATRLCLDLEAYRLSAGDSLQANSLARRLADLTHMCRGVRQLTLTGVPRSRGWCYQPAADVVNGLLALPGLRLVCLRNMSAWEDVPLRFGASLKHLVLEKVLSALGHKAAGQIISQELSSLETLYIKEARGWCDAAAAGSLLLSHHRQLRAVHIAGMQPKVLQLPHGCTFSAQWREWQQGAALQADSCAGLHVLQLRNTCSDEPLIGMKGHWCHCFARLTHLRLASASLGSPTEPVGLGGHFPSLDFLSVSARHIYLHLGAAMPATIHLCGADVCLQSDHATALAAHVTTFSAVTGFYLNEKGHADLPAAISEKLKVSHVSECCTVMFLGASMQDVLAIYERRCHCAACPDCLQRLGVLQQA